MKDKGQVLPPHGFFSFPSAKNDTLGRFWKGGRKSFTQLESESVETDRIPFLPVSCLVTIQFSMICELL